MRLATLVAAMLASTCAGAGEWPAECDHVYTVVVLGTAMKTCPELRVTAAGYLAASGTSKAKNYERCKARAQMRLVAEMAELADAAGGNTDIAVRNWCDLALASSDLSDGGFLERK